MAKQTVVTLIDDIDGSAATETISFGIDGANYVIDLGDKNAKKLRDAVATYVAHARRENAARSSRPAAGGRSGGGGGARGDREHLQAVRAWARDEGKPVSDRGRVSKALLEEYASKH